MTEFLVTGICSTVLTMIMACLLWGIVYVHDNPEDDELSVKKVGMINVWRYFGLLLRREFFSSMEGFINFIEASVILYLINTMLMSELFGSMDINRPSSIVPLYVPTYMMGWLFVLIIVLVITLFSVVFLETKKSM